MSAHQVYFLLSPPPSLLSALQSVFEKGSQHRQEAEYNTMGTVCKCKEHDWIVPESLCGYIKAAVNGVFHHIDHYTYNYACASCTCIIFLSVHCTSFSSSAHTITPKPPSTEQERETEHLLSKFLVSGASWVQ